LHEPKARCDYRSVVLTFNWRNLPDNNIAAMATVYASIEIQDALLKLGIYLNFLSSKATHERSEKIVLLATETFLKFMEN
jgi:hypothetical protein